MRWNEIQPVVADAMWSTMGPAGRDGVDGIDGRPGKDAMQPRDGKDAASFNLRGSWKRTVTYQPLDVVTHDGSSYVAVTANRNRPSTRSKVWQLLAAKGSKGDRGEQGVSMFGRGRQGPPGETIVIGGNAPLEIVFAEPATKGNVIFVDGQARLAKADLESTTGAVGFVIAEGQYITEGQITLGNWNVIAGTSQLVPGEVYYLSHTDAGQITNNPTTVANTYVVAVGRAIGPNTLDIEIQLPILLSGNINSGSGSTQAVFDSPAEVGQPVYVSSNNHVDLAIANSQPEVIGLATTDGYLSEGQVTKTDWSTVADSVNLTPGDCYFLSATTYGKITNVAPTAAGDYVVSLCAAPLKQFHLK